MCKQNNSLGLAKHYIIIVFKYNQPITTVPFQVITSLQRMNIDPRDRQPRYKFEFKSASIRQRFIHTEFSICFFAG